MRRLEDDRPSLHGPERRHDPGQGELEETIDLYEARRQGLGAEFGSSATASSAAFLTGNSP
jgi:hypothetical protein